MDSTGYVYIYIHIHAIIEEEELMNQKDGAGAKEEQEEREGSLKIMQIKYPSIRFSNKRNTCKNKTTQPKSS